MTEQTPPRGAAAGPSLTTHRHLRSTLLCLLYFAQGFPWGFTTVALLAALSEAGHSKAQTATVTALAVLPWTFKFFWAPMIDSLRVPALGLRRPWIALAQLGMAVTLLGLWSSGGLEQESTLRWIAWAFFVHNCFASLQDVATDALAVDMLTDSERGRVNGMMWASKLVGVGVGGAGFGKLIAVAGLGTAVLTQAGIVLAILVVVLLVRERPGERLFPWSAGAVQVSGRHATRLGVWGVARELCRALATRTTLLACAVAWLSALAEGLYVPLTTQLFVQDFGWGAERFSEVQGTLGVGGELVGALLGGVLCDRIGLRRAAAIGMLLTGTVLLVFGATSGLWNDPAYPRAALLPLFKGSLAFMTVCLFSLYMTVAWTGAAACQFTLYMALYNLGYIAGAGLNRLNEWIEAWAARGLGFLEGVELGDAQHYLVAGCAALLPLAVLPWLDLDSIRRRKDAELVAIAPSSSAPEG